MSAPVCVYVLLCMHVCVYMCMCVYMLLVCVCVHKVCVHVCVHVVYLYNNVYVGVYIHMCVNSDSIMCTASYVCWGKGGEGAGEPKHSPGLENTKI